MSADRRLVPAVRPAGGLTALVPAGGRRQAAASGSSGIPVKYSKQTPLPDYDEVTSSNAAYNVITDGGAAAGTRYARFHLFGPGGDSGPAPGTAGAGGEYGCVQAYAAEGLDDYTFVITLGAGGSEGTTSVVCEALGINAIVNGGKNGYQYSGYTNVLGGTGGTGCDFTYDGGNGSRNQLRSGGSSGSPYGPGNGSLEVNERSGGSGWGGVGAQATGAPGGAGGGSKEAATGSRGGRGVAADGGANSGSGAGANGETGSWLKPGGGGGAGYSAGAGGNGGYGAGAGGPGWAFTTGPSASGGVGGGGASGGGSVAGGAGGRGGGGGGGGVNPPGQGGDGWVCVEWIEE